MRNLLYRFYEKQLEAGLRPEDLPKHVGVMVDGNRRWAKGQGVDKAGFGHEAPRPKLQTRPNVQAPILVKTWM